MDSETFSLQQMKLRAFDLSDRTIKRGEASAIRRMERWQQRAFMIVERSVTAGGRVADSERATRASGPLLCRGFSHRWIAREFSERRLPTAAQDHLREIGDATSHVQLSDSMSAVVILAQIRSLVADLMQLSGMDYLEARELIPDMD
jgi:hypothetical protein